MALIISYLLIGIIIMCLIDIGNQVDVTNNPQHEINNKIRIGFIILWPIVVIIIMFITIKKLSKNK
jgi:hypothetical protein